MDEFAGKIEQTNSLQPSISFLKAKKQAKQTNICFLFGQQEKVAVNNLVHFCFGSKLPKADKTVARPKSNLFQA